MARYRLLQDAFAARSTIHAGRLGLAVHEMLKVGDVIERADDDVALSPALEPLDDAAKTCFAAYLRNNPSVRPVTPEYDENGELTGDKDFMRRQVIGQLELHNGPLPAERTLMREARPGIEAARQEAELSELRQQNKMLGDKVAKLADLVEALLTQRAPEPPAAPEPSAKRKAA